MDNRNDQLDSQRLLRVEAEGHETRQEMAALKSDVSNIMTVLSRVENAMMNQPPTWSNGTVLVLVASIGAFLFGITEYVHLTQDPLRSELRSLSEWKHDKDEFQRATHHRMGEQQVFKESVDRRFDYLFDMLINKDRAKGE